MLLGDEQAQLRTSRNFPARNGDPLAEWIESHGEPFEADRNQDLNRFADTPPVFLLTKGWVLRSRAVNSDRESTVATYIPGDTMNLDCVIEPDCWDALEPLTAVTGYRASCDRLKSAIADQPELAFATMRRFIADSDWLREALGAIGQLSAKDRLLFFVAQTRRRMIAYGSLDRDKRRFELPLTQTQLAKTIGTSFVHANRVVKEHHSAGIMTLRRGIAYIPDLAAFERQVEEISNTAEEGNRREKRRYS